MPVHTYRYGEARDLPGLSLGVTRHLPRGVKRTEYAARGFFDVWLPLLAPSAELLARFLKGELTFVRFGAAYRREMRRPEPRQVIRLLAAVAAHQQLNLGCFCADAQRCHRTLLADLLESEGAGRATPPSRPFASPACAMPEIED